jgi:hypothetical protein
MKICTYQKDLLCVLPLGRCSFEGADLDPEDYWEYMVKSALHYMTLPCLHSSIGLSSEARHFIPTLMCLILVVSQKRLTKKRKDVEIRGPIFLVLVGGNYFYLPFLCTIPLIGHDH